jgi:hypothetical protein
MKNSNNMMNKDMDDRIESEIIVRKDDLITSIAKPIKEKYKLSNKIMGQGTYGCVVKA